MAGQFRLPPEVGVPFVNRLDRRDRSGAPRRRKAGNTEAREAHAADALLLLAKGGGKGRAGRADVVFVCDLRAAARGHTHGDELCHVIGGGPVPVEVVRAAAVDAFVKVVVRDGTKVDTIVHYGRHIPALLRTVLELGDPERLDGAVCVDLVVIVATIWSGTTTIPSPTTASPATRTSTPDANPTTGPRPNATARPVCSRAERRSDGRRDQRLGRRAGGWLSRSGC